MKIRTRIFLCFFVLIVAGFWYLLNWVTEDIRPRYMESVEESLVDESAILASVLSERLDADGAIVTDGLSEVFDGLGRRRFEAQIYDLVKTNVDVRIYVTDAEGVVLFDSDAGKAEGENYSTWNDVFLTLQGKYGARATPTVPGDPNTLVLYVAAPILAGADIAGCVTVCKPITQANRFIKSARRKIIAAGTLSLAVLALLGFLTTAWITRPIQRLTRYAAQVRDGERPSLPDLGASEVGEMGQTMEEMRHALEGKEYIEHYVQTLTHELKGPLSAVSGAAELLREDMPAERRERFLENVQTETDRIRRIVDRLLLLSSVESRKELKDVEEIELGALLREAVKDDLMVSLDAKTCRVEISGDDEPVTIEGERFLIRHALLNLLQNAIDFSLPDKPIRVSLERRAGKVEVKIEDEGPGIPDYALPRVTERFFSMQRPDTGKKSSGLGLSFVQEVAELHGGRLEVGNREEGGVVVRLVFQD